MMEQYKPKSNKVTNALLIALIMLVFLILGVISDMRKNVKNLQGDIYSMQGDLIELTSGIYTGQIGEFVGNDFKIEKK